MDTNFEVDVVSQQNIINIYLILIWIIPIATIPIYLAAFYCLIYESYSFNTHYRVVLTFHIILCFLSEWYAFFFMRPVLVLPMVGIYADGLLTYFDVPTFKQIVFYFLLFQVNISSVIHLLLIRLKANIPPTYESYSCLMKLGTSFIVVLYSAAFLSFVTLLKFNLLTEDQSLAKLYMASNIQPEKIPNNFWSDNFVVTSGLYQNFESFLKLRVVMVTFYVIIGFILPIITSVVIYKTKYLVSTTVLETKKDHLKTLTVQVICIFLILLIPFVILRNGLTNKSLSPVIIALSLILCMSYGFVSTLALLMSHKPYRNMVKSPIKHVKTRGSRSNKIDPVVVNETNQLPQVASRPELEKPETERTSEVRKLEVSGQDETENVNIPANDGQINEEHSDNILIEKAAADDEIEKEEGVAESESQEAETKTVPKPVEAEKSIKSNGIDPSTNNNSIVSATNSHFENKV